MKWGFQMLLLGIFRQPIGRLLPADVLVGTFSRVETFNRVEMQADYSLGLE